MADVLQTLADAPTPATDPMGSEARKSAYRIAELLSQQGLDTSPISSPWQGLARMAQAGFGGWDRSLLEREEKSQTAAFRKLLNQDPRLATGESAAPAAPPADRVATVLAGLTPPAPREGDAVLPRMQAPPAPREGALPPPTSGPRPPTAPPLIQQPVRQATEGVMPADGLPGSGYGDDSYRMPLDQMRPPQASVRQAVAGPGATGPTPSPAPANSMAPLPGSDAPIVPKQVQAVPVQPPTAPPQAAGAGAPPAQANRMPTQMTPQIAQYIRQLRATNNPAALAQAEALTKQYSQPTKYDVKVAGDKIIKTDEFGNVTTVGDANKQPDALDIVHAMMADPVKYGYTGKDDPRLARDAGYRLSGLQTPGQSVRDQADSAALKDVQDSWIQAQKMKPALMTARNAIEKAPEGTVGVIAAQWARIASGLGLPIPQGANEAQLLQSITTQLAPLYKQPGATSNAEMGLYMQAAANLGDTKQANLMKLDLFDKLMDRAGDIVNVMRRHAGTDKMYDELAKLDKPIFSPEERKNLEAGLTPQGGQPNPTFNIQDTFNDLEKKFIGATGNDPAKARAAAVEELQRRARAINEHIKKTQGTP